MIKIDLSRTIAERMDITIKQADEFLNVWTDLVGECLEKGDSVQLAGFGQFSVRFVPKHTGRNPKTGQTLQVPASYYPIFKAGKGLKSRVANSKQAIDGALSRADKEQVPNATRTPTKSVRKKSAHN